ncbi:MAG: DNA polymerase III subunit delta [Verrucomicrobia bacterium]|nr:MAG: DNA polymerase III subunit delta [Verrucomicrobiota bacterium]
MCRWNALSSTRCHSRRHSRHSPSSSEKPIHLVDVRNACEKRVVPKTKTKAASAKLYAVVGSDEAEVKRVATELATNLTPAGAGDFGLEVIDGAADNAEQAAARIRSAIEALQTLPFFGSTKVVWLKNANFLSDDPKARSAAVQSALEQLSELLDRGFGSEVTFLISATEVDKRRGFYKMLVKRAELQVFDRLDSGRAGWEEEATEIVQLRAKKRKLQFDDDALDLFVLLTGGDTRQIENELEKIDTFLGNDRAVHVDVVREIVPLSRAGIIFEVSNALAMRDLELALTLVRRLLDQGESAIGILLAAIVPTIRNLLLAKDLMERHRLPRPHSPFQFISAINRLPAKATEHLPRKKDGSINAYALGIAAQHAHHFETNQLIDAMRACLEANRQLVTTQLDHELILTEVVVKLLGKQKL